MTKHIYEHPQAVAQAVAQSVFVQGTQTGDLHVAISGGSTPRLLFELMAQPPLREEIHWERVHLYWVDERCVPPTDEQSNYKMTREALLCHVPIPEAQVHRIMGENDPTEEARRYTELVERLPQKEGLPVFDAIILGMGEDGHTSSIFPHRMDLLTERTPYVATTHTSGQPRIAMTGATILAAHRLIFHVTGQAKKPVLLAIQQGEAVAGTYPSTYFFRQREDVELYTDISL